jgi:hypothetical protein
VNRDRGKLILRRTEVRSASLCSLKPDTKGGRRALLRVSRFRLAIRDRITRPLYGHPSSERHYTRRKSYPYPLRDSRYLCIVLQTRQIYLRLWQTSCIYIRRNWSRVHVVPVIASLNIKDSRYQPFKEVSEKVANASELTFASSRPRCYQRFNQAR